MVHYSIHCTINIRRTQLLMCSQDACTLRGGNVRALSTSDVVYTANIIRYKRENPMGWLGRGVSSSWTQQPIKAYWLQKKNIDMHGYFPPAKYSSSSLISKWGMTPSFCETQSEVTFHDRSMEMCTNIYIYKTYQENQCPLWACFRGEWHSCEGLMKNMKKGMN
jgi:hypothetical protein